MPAAVSKALPVHYNYTTTTNTKYWEDSDEVVIQSYEGGSGHCHNDKARKISSFLKSRFVLQNNLKVGSQITLQLKTMAEINTKFPSPNHEESSLLLPPFSSQNLVQNLLHFNISSNSEAAYVMNLTLHKCEEKNPINGKLKYQFCATSLKDLLSFVGEKLGLKGLKAVSPPSASADSLSRYRVVSAKPLAAEGKLILCHRYGFPYAVFYCHQPAATRAFSVLLAAQKGRDQLLDTIAICHDETSTWSPDYIGFKALRVQPGTPICHFLHSQDLLWYLN
ncbi:BURP domain-containing protein 5 [Bienertia sinuspersici]